MRNQITSASGADSFQNRLPRTGQSAKVRCESGQALVEMALIVPIVLILVLGVIEIGRYAYIAILVGNAARAGAEFAIQGNAQSGMGTNIIAAAKNDFQNNGQNPNNLNVTFPAAYIGSYTWTSAGPFAACTCDSGGTFNPAQPTLSNCFNPFSGGTNPTPGKCSSGHWVVLTAVEATGTFNSLFLPSGSSFLGIPGSISIDRTSILRVAP
jgi:Flp pilus assembly protein TadG